MQITLVVLLVIAVAAFVVGTGWGTFARTTTTTGWEIEISCAYGSVTF